jgi:hypothetical protein
MRRNTREEMLAGFLAINAMLREELHGLKRTLKKRSAEKKYNPNWRLQPRAPKGTAEGGQWIDGHTFTKPAAEPKPRRPSSPKTRGGRPPVNHNRPGPDSLREVFPGIANAPASAILAPVDALFGISGPARDANEEAVRLVRDHLILEIQQLRPDYRFQSIQPGGMPASIAGRSRMLDGLRLERAVAQYQVRGNIDPLQVETLRFMQRQVDAAYDRAVHLYNAGQLSARLSRNEAIGNYIDSAVRRDLRSLYATLGVSISRGQPVQVNLRARNASDLTYTIPDARVGSVIFDATLSNKSSRSPQIRRFFQSDFGPTAVIIVRPSRLGGTYTYLIMPPSSVAPGG